jgi:hypothetical protein
MKMNNLRVNQIFNAKSFGIVRDVLVKIVDINCKFGNENYILVECIRANEELLTSTLAIGSLNVSRRKRLSCETARLNNLQVEELKTAFYTQQIQVGFLFFMTKELINRLLTLKEDADIFENLCDTLDKIFID